MKSLTTVWFSRPKSIPTNRQWNSIRINDPWWICFEWRENNAYNVEIGVHPRRINETVSRKRNITADITLRLERYFGNSPQFWLGLQMDYDLDMAEELLGNRLEREVKAIAA